MATDVMIDLETLGTRPGCMLLSIGAVVFGSAGLGPELYLEVDYRRLYGLTVDPVTLAWWHDQPPIVRDRLFTPSRDKRLLPSALAELSAWLSEVADGPPLQSGEPDVCVWGNGADFDNAILQVAYEHTGIEPPWAFRKNRCYRTLKGLVPGLKLARLGNHHNALDDARSQAEHATQLLRHLDVWPRG